ncbi:MAG: DUF2970 domain-containing protein [Halieaceae bacterium]|jgi:TRAP-type C4-dicarboxylate transport system permease small subunit|nr:DUF2970 domain-containing protein [Halieaceae bacterium]
MENSQTDNSKPESGKKSLGLMAVLSSVFAAALGVQSSKNRERDFKQGSAGVYIAAGIIFTALFIATVVMVVQWVIASH